LLRSIKGVLGTLWTC